MKEKPAPLRIFNFSHPLMHTEWLTLVGDKYHRTLPFEWEMVKDLSLAQVITWDGVISPKNQPVVNELLEALKGNKILLLIGESMTLLKNHPIVTLLDPKDLKFIEVSGWNVLPEEILAVLESCHQKLNHV
jgi:hypothetical protein